MLYATITAILALIVTIAIILKAVSIPAKIKKAEALLDAGDQSGASEIVKNVLNKKKDYVPAKYLRALIFIRQSQYLLAITELNSVLGISNFDQYVKELDIHYHLAFLYNATQNYQKEIDEYRMILTFNPEDVKANHRIGHALYQKGQFKPARDHLMKAVLLDPALKDCFLPVGISCFNISEYERAEEYLTKAMTVVGDHSEAEYHLGNIYKMKKDYTNAISMLEKSKDNPRYFTKSLFNIGEMHFHQKEYSEAIQVLERGLKGLKERTEEALAYRYLLAECYEIENKIKEAIHHWEKVAAENPNYRSAKIKLESYKEMMENKNLMAIFDASLDQLQPKIVDFITGLNYNIISKEKMSPNEYLYKVYNIKRINDPPLLIHFNRTAREITETQILEFNKKISEEKCRNGIYISTSTFSLKARSSLTQVLFFRYAASSTRLKYAAGKATIYEAALKEQRAALAERLAAYRASYVGQVRFPPLP